MSNKKTIFISYGRDQEHPEDVELVIKIKEDLSKEFNVLMDIDRLKTTDDWENKLSADISSSDWIVFFITPYSARRPDGYCLNELTYGLYKKKSIAPVMLNYEDPPLSICRIQYLDLQKLKDEITYQKKLKEIISVLNEEKKLGFEGGHVALLNKLDPLKFDTVVAKHIHGFVGRQWIYDRVDKWLNEDVDSRVLWITAEAGYGKTALATYLSENHPSSTSIHYCQHDAQKTKDPINVLKTFIYELSTQVPEYHEKLSGIDIEDKLKGSAADIFRELLVEPLFKIKRPNKDLFFIIDALDEAKDGNGKNLIVDLISNRFSDLPLWLNIIITSRPEPEIIRKLKKFNPIELKANEENNLEDMKLYIHKIFKNLEDTKIDALIFKCEGNMLYLKSVLESKSIKNGNFSLEDIENLPQGMEELYQQFFERKFEDTHDYEEKFLDFVNIMVASGEGLPVELIRYILNINERNFRKLKDKFGSLLEENNGTITFYHKSLFDWLNEYDLSADYSADTEMGHSLIITTLWELYKNAEKSDLLYQSYLLYSVYEGKQYDKLNALLQDILFIGQLYNQNEHIIYRKVLLNTIESYLVCDIEKLKIYESFFREKEHFVLQINNENWKPHQTLVQLAYEDGDDSPLSQYIDILLENNKVDFSWIKNVCRSKHHIRTNLHKIFEMKKNIIDIIEYNNKVVLFYVDGTFNALNLHTNVFDIIENVSTIEGISNKIKSYFLDKDLEAIVGWNTIDITVENNTNRFELADTVGFEFEEVIDEDVFGYVDGNIEILEENCIIIYAINTDLHYDTGVIAYVTFDGDVLHYINVHKSTINGVFKMKSNKLLSYSEDSTLIILNLETGKQEFILSGHTDGVTHAIELSNGQILSYSKDHTLRLWNIEVRNESQIKPQYKTSLILSDGSYLSQDESTLLLFDKNGLFKKGFNHHVSYIEILELDDNEILSFGNSHGLYDDKIFIWSSENNLVESYNFPYDDHVDYMRKLKNGNLVLKVRNEFHNQKDKDGYVFLENKYYLWSNKNLTTISEEEGFNSLIVCDSIVVSEYDKFLHVVDQNGISLYKIELDIDQNLEFIIELSNDTYIAYFTDGVLGLWDMKGNLIKTILDIDEKLLYGIQLNLESFILYALDKIFILSIEGDILYQFKTNLLAIQELLIFSDTLFLTYTKDNKITLWDMKGNNLNTFYISIEVSHVSLCIIEEKLYVDSGTSISVYSLENTWKGI